MVDRYELKKAAEVCKKNGFVSCEGCPYDNEGRIGCPMPDKVLELLEEEEQQTTYIQKCYVRYMQRKYGL